MHQDRRFVADDQAVDVIPFRRGHLADCQLRVAVAAALRPTLPPPLSPAASPSRNKYDFFQLRQVIQGFQVLVRQAVGAVHGQDCFFGVLLQRRRVDYAFGQDQPLGLLPPGSQDTARAGCGCSSAARLLS